MLIPSVGGPNWMAWFRVDDPPPLELPGRRGMYVLDPDPVEGLRYLWVEPG